MKIVVNIVDTKTGIILNQSELYNNDNRVMFYSFEDMQGKHISLINSTSKLSNEDIININNTLGVI